MNKLLILTCLVVASQTAKAITIPEIVAQAKPTIIQVLTFDKQDKLIGSGTGFFIDRRGLALLNEDGKVIGIATAGSHEGQNLNFAIATDAIVDALSKYIPEQPPPSRQSPRKDRMAEPAPADLKSFVKEFIEAGNAADPAVEISYYANEVDYFDNGKVTKNFIIADVTQYDKRWPRRAYQLSGEPEITVLDSRRDVAKAVSNFKFTIGNAQKTIWGSGKNVLLIGHATTNPKVISVKSKILERHDIPTAR